MLTRGRYWRISRQKDTVSIEIDRAALDEDMEDVRDARFEVPLERWNQLVRNLNSDRKLLGGLLLDLAKDKERVNLVAGNDRLLGEFRRAVLDATLALVEEGSLVLKAAEDSGEH